MSEKEKIPAASRRQEKPATVDAQKRFENLYQQYLQALGNIQVEGQQRYKEAYEAYMQTLNATLAEGQKSIEDVNRSFVGTMQESWGQENAQSRFTEAYTKMATDLQTRQMGVLKNSENAHQQYMSSLQDVSQTLQKRQLDECLNYLKELQKAWADLDINALDVNTMAVISQTMTAASTYVFPALAARQ
jgi:hypothetical protein